MRRITVYRSVEKQMKTEGLTPKLKLLILKYTYQGSEPKPYHANCNIWNPRPNKMVFLFPIDLISKLKTMVWKKKKKIYRNKVLKSDFFQSIL